MDQASVSRPRATPSTWRRQFGRALAALDAVTIGFSTGLAYWLRDTLGAVGVVGEFAAEVPAALGVLPLWLLILYFAGAYRPEVINSAGDAFRRFTAGTVGGVFTLGFLSFLFNWQLSRLFVGLLFVTVFLLGGLVRIGIRHYLRDQYARGRLIQNVLIVGADGEGRELGELLRTRTDTGFSLIGYLDDECDDPESLPAPLLGATNVVLKVAQDHEVGLVIASPTGLAPGTLQDMTVSLEGSPVDLAVAPALFQVVTRRMTVESVANVPILHVDQIRLQSGKAFIKRTLDVVAAALLGLILSPITLAATVAIYAHDRGPALFRQTRVGKDGQEFEVLKFRTMRPDAEERLGDVEHLNEVGDKFFKVRDDPRVTRVGRFLRQWSIDEIPQLWNVLKGDMSMVGPRPPVPAEVAQYTDWELRRLRVRPGITGVWQTSGRSNIPFDEAIRLDLFYIENWSLGYDLFLLGKTVLAVLSRRGAY